MAAIGRETCTPANGIQAVRAKSRFNNRRVEVYEYSGGKVTRSQRSGIARTFKPASPFDGQALAGTGALVFEGELLRN